MQQRVTIKDIARKTGTSVTSVHRALYGRSGISESLRSRILTEVERSNYQVDEAASLLRRKQYDIVVVLPKPQGQERFYYRGMWEGIYKGAEEIKRHKVRILFRQWEKGISRIGEALEQLYDETDEALNGLITVCDDERSKEWIQRFIKRGTRVALVDRGADLENLSFCIESSTRDMGHLAMNIMHLLTGEKRGDLILVNGPEERVSYRGYRTAIEEKLELHPGEKLVILDGYEEKSGRRQLRELLENKEIKGIICGCARASYWVCEEADEWRQKGKKLPPVVGMDVFEELIPFFENGVLKATVYQSHREQGEKAVKQLYACLSNPQGEAVVREESSLSVVLKENYKYFMDQEKKFAAEAVNK